MDITKAKEFLEKQGLDDCHYQDSGMIEHIAEQMEMYHTEQLRLGAVVGQSEQLVCPCCGSKNIEMDSKWGDFKCKNRNCGRIWAK